MNKEDNKIMKSEHFSIPLPFDLEKGDYPINKLQACGATLNVEINPNPDIEAKVGIVYDVMELHKFDLKREDEDGNELEHPEIHFESKIEAYPEMTISGNDGKIPVPDNIVNEKATIKEVKSKLRDFIDKVGMSDKEE